MAMKTYQVDSFGRACYVTDLPGKTSVTVECYDESVAYQFFTRAPVISGEWYFIRGKFDMVTGIKRSGRPRDDNTTYFQKPKDGSKMVDWSFHQINASGVEKAGTEYLVGYLSRRFRSLSRRKRIHRQDMIRTMQVAKIMTSCIKSRLERPDVPVILTPEVSV